MNGIPRKACLALLLLGSAVPSLGADSKPDDSKAAQLAITVCAACHGSTGQSAVAENPHLAAQQAQYITAQLANFKSGVRNNPIMQGMASMLEPADMKALGRYYFQQVSSPAGTKDAKKSALGQQLYRFGNATTGLPACSACHAPSAAGIPAQYPRLAGQFASYTVAQLRAFKAGQRGNHEKDANGKTMAAVAAKMSDTEILAVSDFLAGMR